MAEKQAAAAALRLSAHSVNHLIEAVSRAHGTPGTTVLVARVLGERLRACEASLAAVEQRVRDRRGDGG